MDYKKRNKEIHRLKIKEGKSLRQLADKYGITRERVRQIVDKIEKPPKKCHKHDNKYTNECRYCLIEEQYKMISRLDIKTEIEYVKQHGREKDTILRKQLLIGRLIDKEKLSIRKVGYLLDNDHTTILHHYKKYELRRKG